jgi:hypothetical protein
VTTNTISRLTLTGGDIYGNGGAVFSRENMTISGSMISGNAIFGDSTGYGGAIFTERQSGSASVQMVVRESTISGNVTNRFGGGIASRGAELTIVNSSFQNNSARNGGGISGLNGSTTIASSSFNFNSASSLGGGIYLHSSATTIASSSFGANSANAGGGIDSTFSKLTVQDSAFISNEARVGDGGAIRNRHGELSVYASAIHNNFAKHDGGGVFGPGTLVGCDVSVNGADHSGGGIFSDSLHLTDSIVVGNSAVGDGGGVFSSAGNLTAIGTTFEGNQAGQNGGGIFRSDGEGQTMIRSSTISGNLARFGGGFYGIAQSLGTIDIRHTTVAHNIASSVGGGVHFLGDGVSIDHTIVASNIGPFGPDITGVLGTSFRPTFSLIGNNRNSGLAEAPIGSPDMFGNLIGGDIHGLVDPRLVPFEISPRQIWINVMHTYRLLPGSPAIDAGDPGAMAGIEEVPQYDQRGAPYTRVYKSRIDIGAFETQPLFGDYNVDGIVDAADDVIWRNTRGSATDLRADGNADGIVNDADRLVWRANFGRVLASGGQAAESIRLESDAIAPKPPALPAGNVGAAVDSSVESAFAALRLRAVGSRLTRSNSFEDDAIDRDSLLSAIATPQASDDKLSDYWQTTNETGEKVRNELEVGAVAVDLVFEVLGAG